MASATPDLLTFPATEHRRHLIATKLYRFVTEAHVYEQLALGCYLQVERPGVEPATFCVASQHANHYTTRPHGWAKKLHTKPMVIILSNLDRFSKFFQRKNFW